MSTAIKPTPEIYREAARIIEEYGWNCEKLRGYSMASAIGRACGVERHEKVKPSIVRLERSARKHADYYIAMSDESDYGDCRSFNDSCRSAKPVIKMLNDIADALEKEEANA